MSVWQSMQKMMEVVEEDLQAVRLDAGGAYVPTFFVGMYAPLVRLRPPLPSYGTLSIASSEASCRK